MTTIIIFFLAIITAFGMLAFRAWEIRTARVETLDDALETNQGPTFRQIERSMLYLIKHIVQSVVLALAKVWFIVTTKIKKFVVERLPRVHSFFAKKLKLEAEKPARLSFVQKAVLESKSKIRRIKEKVKKDHEEEDTAV